MAQPLRRFTPPSSPMVNPETGVMTPEWRAYITKLGATLRDLAEITVLDSATAYTNDQLRDKIIALQTAIGAEVV